MKPHSSVTRRQELTEQAETRVGTRNLAIRAYSQLETAYLTYAYVLLN